jgi:hypothetical protein
MPNNKKQYPQSLKRHLHRRSVVAETLVTATMAVVHRDRSKHAERANMHCQCIACSRLFGMGLIPAVGNMLENLVMQCATNICAVSRQTSPT